MPSFRSISWIATWALALAGCNSSEQVAAVSTAADGYCACVQAQMRVPLDQVESKACDSEYSAFQGAWGALTKVDDDSMQKYFDLVHSCHLEFGDISARAYDAREHRQ